MSEQATMTSNRLPVLAADIQREHAAVGEAAARGLKHALAAGEALLEAKAALAHGAWASWLAANVPGLSARTAQLYMRLARNRDRLNAQRVADLSLRAAAALVSERGDERASLDRVQRAGAIGDELAAGAVALLMFVDLRDFLRRGPAGDMPAAVQIALCLDVINATAEGVDPDVMAAHRASFERGLAAQ